MARLFIALEIPGGIANDLELMQGGLENARWVDPQSFHVTLRFLGEIDGVQHAKVHDALSAIKAAPFSMSLSGFGIFGHRKPRAVWARIKANAALTELNATIERACQRAGLDPEPRNFTPHVTLARFKGTNRHQVEAYAASHNLYLSESFDVTRFILFSSKLSHGGGPYVAEQIYPLTEGLS